MLLAGRRVRVALDAASRPVPDKLSFQNLGGAQVKMRQLFNYDLGWSLAAVDWALACRCFQKRRLLAHSLGVVDEEYVTKARDPEAVVGRVIRIRPDEVRALIVVLLKARRGDGPGGRPNRLMILASIANRAPCRHTRAGAGRISENASGRVRGSCWEAEIG